MREEGEGRRRKEKRGNGGEERKRGSEQSMTK